MEIVKIVKLNFLSKVGKTEHYNDSQSKDHRKHVNVGGSVVKLLVFQKAEGHNLLQNIENQTAEQKEPRVDQQDFDDHPIKQQVTVVLEPYYLDIK